MFEAPDCLIINIFMNKIISENSEHIYIEDWIATEKWAFLWKMYTKVSLYEITK